MWITKWSKLSLIKIQQACILSVRDIMWKYRTKAVFYHCAHTEHCIIIIDEPISPSVDREAAPIPPSAVVSVAPSITTGPSSPGSPCPPIRRQLSHDQGKQHRVGWVMDTSMWVWAWFWGILLGRTKYTSLKCYVSVFTLNDLNDNTLIKVDIDSLSFSRLID